MKPPYDNSNLREAERRIEMALSNLHLLHIGPLDHNVAVTVDDLLAATHLIEEFQRAQVSEHFDPVVGGGNDR